MYKLLIREKLSKELRKLNKKNHVLFEAIFKKTDEICINPQHYKNLNYPLIVLHQLDQKIIYPHYDFKHLTEKYFEIGMKLDDFLIQLVKY